MNIAIANRLAELRKQNGYSQEELANKLGISRQSISKWERGEASPDTDNLIELSKIYGITLDELINTDVNLQEVKEKSKSKKVIDVSVGFNKEQNEKNRQIRGIITSCMFLIATIAYLLIGFLSNSPYANWANMWVLFLLPIVIESIIKAIQRKRASKFALPVFIIMVYCYLGLTFGYWHPHWVMFLTIPLFYSITSPIEHHLKLDIEDDDDDDDDDDKEVTVNINKDGVKINTKKK